ncbi:MAG: hypothetical protein HOP19_22275 [Acidobacteria bacterium]|nr:hypothetical protein [Acidobacteriota bacterium]
MRRFIYQGNFCAECGNALVPQRRQHFWTARYLCDECEVQLRRADRLPARGWPWLLIGSVAGLFYLFNHPTATTSPAPMPPAVQTAVAAPLPMTPPPVVAEAEPAFCGARTKRGTPCRRMVKSRDERCAQHRGKPSIANPLKP